MQNRFIKHINTQNNVTQSGHIQHSNTQHNDTQYNDNQGNGRQNYDTHHVTFIITHAE
jgi:hypothetical protein